MKLLPQENITFTTSLTNEEAIQRLSEFVLPDTVVGTGIGSKKTYEGRINGQTFEIRRRIGYRNSFLPRIIGTIETNNNRTTINVRMKLHTFTIGFLYFFMSFASLMFITFLVLSINNSEFNPGLFIPLGMLIFALLLANGGFKFESGQSIKDLKAIFNAEIAER